jgi:hypothetical protein
MTEKVKSLIEIYEENIVRIEANIREGKGGPKKQEYRRCALARLQMKLAHAKAGNPLPTYAETTRRQRNRHDYALV